VGLGHAGEGGRCGKGLCSDQQGVAIRILARFPFHSPIGRRDFSGSEEETLKRIGKAISSYPPGFTPHRNLARILSARGKTVEEGRNIDWSTAEALAFGSLALEKIHVRISGQDVERGTFCQRHAVIHDQKNEQQYIPLNDIGANQAQSVVCNSSLSEYGTLGFELDYSLVSLNFLTIWERHLEISQTTLNASSTNSLLLGNVSGCSAVASSRACPTGTMAKALNIRAEGWSVSSSFATITLTSSLHRRRSRGNIKIATCKSCIQRTCSL